MSKKQHEKENIDVVRRILDNPQQSPPDTKNIYLETLRRRLLHQSRHHFQQPSSSTASDTSLAPQVTIHHTTETKQQPVEEETQESFTQDQQASDVDQRFFRPEEDLFEIEHVGEDEIPDFIEVKPKDQITVLQSDETSSSPDQKPESTPLPKWELVEEEQETPSETKKEFEEVESTEETVFSEEEEPDDQETMIWEPADQKGIHEESDGKKPLFKKFTREKPVFESKDEKEPRFLVKDLKTSIKKLHGKEPDSPFKYKGYTLYQKEMDLGNNKKRIIHFFSKDTPEDSTPSPLPKDYEVRVNKKTGVPYIRKKET